MKLTQGWIVLLAVITGGCASSNSGDVYSRDEARRVQTVQFGTVESVRSVKIEGTQSGIGAGAGAALARSRVAPRWGKGGVVPWRRCLVL